MGQEDPLGKGMAIYFSILAWSITMDIEFWQATVHWDHKESDTTERLTYTYTLYSIRNYDHYLVLIDNGI